MSDFCATTTKRYCKISFLNTPQIKYNALIQTYKRLQFSEKCPCEFQFAIYLTHIILYFQVERDN